MKRIYVTLASLINWFMLSAQQFSGKTLLQIEAVKPQGISLGAASLEELIKLLIAVIGGLASTLLLAFLKRRYPFLFEMQKSDKSNTG